MLFHLTQRSKTTCQLPPTMQAHRCIFRVHAKFENYFRIKNLNCVEKIPMACQQTYKLSSRSLKNDSHTHCRGEKSIDSQKTSWMKISRIQFHRWRNWRAHPRKKKNIERVCGMISINKMLSVMLQLRACWVLTFVMTSTQADEDKKSISTGAKFIFLLRFFYIIKRTEINFNEAFGDEKLHNFQCDLMFINAVRANVKAIKQIAEMRSPVRMPIDMKLAQSQALPNFVPLRRGWTCRFFIVNVISSFLKMKVPRHAYENWSGAGNKFNFNFYFKYRGLTYLQDKFQRCKVLIALIDHDTRLSSMSNSHFH